MVKDELLQTGGKLSEVCEISVILCIPGDDTWVNVAVAGPS